MRARLTIGARSHGRDHVKPEQADLARVVASSYGSIQKTARFTFYALSRPRFAELSLGSDKQRGVHLQVRLKWAAITGIIC